MKKAVCVIVSDVSRNMVFVAVKGKTYSFAYYNGILYSPFKPTKFLADIVDAENLLKKQITRFLNDSNICEDEVVYSSPRGDYMPITLFEREV